MKISVSEVARKIATRHVVERSTRQALAHDIQEAIIQHAHHIAFEAIDDAIAKKKKPRT